MSWFNNLFDDDKGEDVSSKPVVNAPATAEDFDAFQRIVGQAVPRSLAVQYRQRNGVAPKNASSTEVLRLMPLREAADMHQSIAQAGLQELAQSYGMVCFWTDDNSNYAGVFISGLLEGRVFFLDHDGNYLGDFSPVFRSIGSFLEKLGGAVKRNRVVEAFEEGFLTEEALTERLKDFPSHPYCDPFDMISWDGLETDYPSQPGKYTNDDGEAYDQCRRKIATCAEPEERRFLIYSAARLVPPGGRADLFDFLKEDDMWMPARLSQMLGNAGCFEAIPQIVTLSLKGNFNCRSSARHVLAKMMFQTREVQGAIKAEYSRLGGDFSEVLADLERLRASPALFHQW